MGSADAAPPDEIRRSARARLELLDGLTVALDNRDRLVRIVSAAPNRDVACLEVRREFDLSETQAIAVLDLQIFRLTVDARQRIADERDRLRRDTDELGEPIR